MRRIVFAAKAIEQSRFLLGSIAGFCDFVGTAGSSGYFFVKLLL
ncbi:MAG: hypothetical protein ACD_75C00550G0002 [uncultured bacterium]|nr:MAG: hypothetical protein ACD_75C00550G0002 [uncultured bacterium]